MFMRVRKSLPVRSIPPAKSFTPGGGFQTFWNSWNVSEDFDIPTLAKCEKAVPEICELPPEHYQLSAYRGGRAETGAMWSRLASLRAEGNERAFMPSISA
jgi:hypothetical protein